MRYTVTVKWVASITLALVLGTMFIGLFHMSMGTDMSGGMTDCPFMVHEEVICPMNLADHMEAWQSVFLSVAPTLTSLLALAGLTVLLASAAPNLLQRIRYFSPPLLQAELKPRNYTYWYRPLQELFASGILHPKLYG